MENIASAVAKTKRNLTALPLLVVLFVVSYYLLTKLVIEQDKTIDSQRSLLHQLFKDKVYLSRLRRQTIEFSKKHKAADRVQIQADNSVQTPSSRAPLTQVPLTQVPLTQVPLTQVPLTQVPLTQVPLTQVPLTQVPSSEIGPQANAKTNRRTRKAGKAFSARSPVEPTDPSDMRRVTFSI